MQAVRRLAGGEAGIVTDAGLGILAAGLTADAGWGPPGLMGTTLTGPWWLRAVLPLLIGAPLVLRRRAPLLMWIAIWPGIALQSLLTADQRAWSSRSRCSSPPTRWAHTPACAVGSPA